MLIQFSVENYKSFREQQTLNLTAIQFIKTLPENVVEHNQTEMSGTKLLTSAGIFGANSAGKTNLLQALRDLSKFVIEEQKFDKLFHRCAQVYQFQQDLEKPTVFEVNFDADTRYRYTLAVTSQRIEREVLEVKGKNRLKLVYRRTWEPALNDYKYEFGGDNARIGHTEIFSKLTLHTRAFLSNAYGTKNPIMNTVNDWFRKQIIFYGINDDINWDRTVTRLLNNKKDDIVNILQYCDLGIDDIELVGDLVSCECQQCKHKWTTELKVFKEYNSYCPKCYGKAHILLQNGSHPDILKLRYKGSDIKKSSKGTIRVIALLGYILDALDTGGVLVVDDVDLGLHPLLLIRLLKLFNADCNPKHAQLIFTAHNPILLDEVVLRYDQIWFMTKNYKNESTLGALSDYKLRKNVTPLKGYLTGQFQGIPLIPDNLTR